MLLRRAPLLLLWEVLGSLVPGGRGGLHTWQAILGCEQGEDDESKGGFLKYSHDGMDFVSFDKKTLRWMTAQPQAQKVKEKWDYGPQRSQRYKVYIETCIKMMQKYLPHQTESLKKTAGVWRILLGIVAAGIVLVIMLSCLILFLTYLGKKLRNNLYQEVATCGSSTNQSFSLYGQYRS